MLDSSMTVLVSLKSRVILPEASESGCPYFVFNENYKEFMSNCADGVIG